METHTKQRHTEFESIDAVTVDCHSLLQVAGSSLAGNPRPQLPKHLCDTTSLIAPVLDSLSTGHLMVS